MRGLGQLPRTYAPFVLVSVFGPLLVMLGQGDPIHPSVPALAFLALLLAGLARRSTLAWALLLLWNLFFAFAVFAAATGGGQIAWGGPLLLPVFLGSVALLLSPSMRQHVGVSRGARASRLP